MPKVEKHAPGTFCWTDLTTTDQPGAKAFYAALLGWEMSDMPIGEEMIYTFARKQGADIAAISPPAPGQESMPAVWSTYVAVENADDTVRRAKILGAHVLMEPMTVMEEGRMAVLQDPTGAVISLWQPQRHKGMQLVGDEGAVCWFELSTRDPKRAAVFYSELFGWRAQPSKGNSTYTEFFVGEQGIGGMLTMDDKWPASVPANWGVYFTVANCDETVERCKRLGGTVCNPPMNIPGVGRMATLADPKGAMFSVITLQMK